MGNFVYQKFLHSNTPTKIIFFHINNNFLLIFIHITIEMLDANKY